jgi:hypothetical protein
MLLLQTKSGRGRSPADSGRPAGRGTLSASERDGVADREIPSFDDPVLVGTDDSARSRDALALGRMLADATRSQMLSVYVHHFEDVGGLLSGGRRRRSWS